VSYNKSVRPFNKHKKLLSTYYIYIEKKILRYVIYRLNKINLLNKVSQNYNIKGANR